MSDATGQWFKADDSKGRNDRMAFPRGVPQRRIDHLGRVHTAPPGSQGDPALRLQPWVN